MMGAEVTTRPYRSLFTATQWQELEHQALIYKYMVSGVPIPHELIFSVRRSLVNSSSFNPRLMPHQPIGWGCYQAGYGRKTDPEPGRCRRTDGKKWRCSREAYIDSKYCEKHMHRGRNRSRKPVETTTTTTTSSTTTTSTCFSSADNILNMNQSYPKCTNAYLRHSPYPSSSSSSSSSSSCSFKLLDQNNGSQINVFGSGRSSQTAERDFRYLQGVRQNSDEKSLFTEASGTRGLLQDWSYQPLTVSSNTCSYNKNYTSEQQQQHCFLMGTDMFKPATSSIKNTEKVVEDEEESKKPIHHFFGDDWPPVKHTSDSWLDLASNTSLHTGS